MPQKKISRNIIPAICMIALVNSAMMKIFYLFEILDLLALLAVNCGDTVGSHNVLVERDPPTNSK
jgi:hypothetical protein